MFRAKRYYLDGEHLNELVNRTEHCGFVFRHAPVGDWSKFYIIVCISAHKRKWFHSF